MPQPPARMACGVLDGSVPHIEIHSCNYRKYVSERYLLEISQIFKSKKDSPYNSLRLGRMLGLGEIRFFHIATLLGNVTQCNKGSRLRSSDQWHPIYKGRLRISNLEFVKIVWVKENPSSAARHTDSLFHPLPVLILHYIILCTTARLELS